MQLLCFCNKKKYLNDVLNQVKHPPYLPVGVHAEN